jgi:hypothetical protein
MEDDLRRKQLLLGVVLAWAPLLPMVVGLSYLSAGIGRSWATGLAAVAGGVGET